jgi:hypothetical protein
MVAKGEKTYRRFHRFGVVAGGWFAITLLFLITLGTWPSSSQSFHTSGVAWGLGTLAVMVVIAALTFVAVKDAVVAGGGPSTLDWVQRFGLTLCAGAWFFGGLITLTLYYFWVPYNIFSNVAGDVCGGSGGLGSFECLHRPGRLLEGLGIAFSLIATPAAYALSQAGPRSRLRALLSPIVIFGLYLLALRMWQPHVGLGVPHRSISAS